MPICHRGPAPLSPKTQFRVQQIWPRLNLSHQDSWPRPRCRRAGENDMIPLYSRLCPCSHTTTLAAPQHLPCPSSRPHLRNTQKPSKSGRWVRQARWGNILTVRSITDTWTKPRRGRTLGGSGDGWGRGEWWEANGDNCSWATTKKKKEVESTSPVWMAVPFHTHPPVGRECCQSSKFSLNRPWGAREGLEKLEIQFVLWEIWFSNASR